MNKNLIEQWTQIQRKLAGLQAQMGEPHGSTAWTPNTDVYDVPGGLVVKVELAGIPHEAIQVYLTEEALVIEGIRRDPYAGETGAGYRFRQMEIEYGPFRRVVQLPYPVNGQSARAHVSGGILEIRLMRAEKQVARRITIVMHG